MQRRPSTQDITWFLDLNRRNQLDLNPPYQRRSVWNLRDKRFFLDTIFNNFPCPPVFLFKTMSSDGIPTYHVIDGKQRLETIIAFSEDKIALSKDMADERLRGKKWKHINDPEVKARFWNYIMSVELLDSIDGTVINEVFDRFNRNSRNLERQELRHARFGGWFISIVEDETGTDKKPGNPIWRRFGIVTAAKAKRMKDVQFISELLLVMLDGDISGFDQDYIDQKYVEFDDPYESKPDFSAEEFGKWLKRILDILSEMESLNNAITKNARSANHFYTLWSAIVFNEHLITNIPEFSKKYVDFLSKVGQISAKVKANEFIASQIEPDFNLPYQYYVNSIGANTESAQRRERLAALVTSLFGTQGVLNRKVTSEPMETQPEAEIQVGESGEIMSEEELFDYEDTSINS